MKQNLASFKGQIGGMWETFETRFLNARLLAFFFVFILSFLFSREAPQWFDLTISDDNDYMAEGLRIGSEVEIASPAWNPDWAPLYYLWFFLLSRLYSGPEEIFYGSLQLVGMLTPIFMYLVLQKARVFPLLAAGVSLAFLTTYANWRAEPRVMNFALLVLLIIWWIGSFFHHRWQRLWILAMLSLFTAYVRPEFFLATVLLMMIALSYLLFLTLKQGIQFSRTDLMLIAGIAGIIATLFLWWGIPFSGDRSIYAFGQHYTRNVASCFSEDHPHGVPWEEILARDFGKPSNIVQAFFNNPRAFSRHVLCNLQNIPKTFLMVTFVNAWTNSWFFIKLFIAIMVWQLVFHIRSIRLQFQWLWEQDMMLLGLVFLIPAGLSIVLVFPREHYIILPSLLFFMLATMILGGHSSSKNEIIVRRQTLVGGLLLVALFPSMGALFNNVSPEKPNLVTIHEVKKLDIRENIRMLATRPFQATFAKVYFDDQFVALPYKPYDVTFQNFFLENQPNVILITQNGREYSNDPTWDEFRANFQEYGFKEIILSVRDPWGPWRLYVKEMLP